MVLMAGAIAQEKEQNRHRHRDSEEPQQNVPKSPHLLDSFFEFHIDLILLCQ